MTGHPPKTGSSPESSSEAFFSFSFFILFSWEPKPKGHLPFGTLFVIVGLDEVNPKGHFGFSTSGSFFGFFEEVNPKGHFGFSSSDFLDEVKPKGHLGFSESFVDSLGEDVFWGLLNKPPKKLVTFL